MPPGRGGRWWPESTTSIETENYGRSSGRTQDMEDIPNLGQEKLINIDGNDINIKYRPLCHWEMIELPAWTQ